MSVHSAGILCYRYRDKVLEVFLVHPGGPLWSHRDEGAWSIPKGLLEAGEEALSAAIREFNEETGFSVSEGFVTLGELTQPNKKIVHAWAVQTDFDALQLTSNLFSMEWPRGSGQIREFPEVDRGQWFTLYQARMKMYKGQHAFLDRLEAGLRTKSDKPGIVN